MADGLMSVATALLSSSERRLEAVSRNVSGATLPGYKREMSFAAATSGVASFASVPSSFSTATSEPDGSGSISSSTLPSSTPLISEYTDESQGAVRATGRGLDLALSGPGYFALRTPQGEVVYTRQGQFSRSAEGQLLGPQGYALQAAGGGDLVTASGEIEVLEDGTVLEAGLPTGRVGVMTPSAVKPLAGGVLFEGRGEAQAAEGTLVRQGMLEGSNVEMAVEMVEMMAAIRQAEVGARLVQAYDALLGRAITTFGSG